VNHGKQEHPMMNEKPGGLLWCLVAGAAFVACGGGSDDGNGSGAGGSASTATSTSGSATTTSATGTSGAGGTSGSTGSGGSDTDAGGTSDEGGLACGVKAGACVNTADCSIGKAQIDPKVATCARTCAGGSKCTADCLVKEGVTTACAQCWGDVTQCGRDNCLSACFSDPGSAACRECTKTKGCDDAFKTCSGW
jgi:hypothetical protein